MTTKATRLQERAAQEEPAEGEGVYHFERFEIDGVEFVTREEALAIFNREAQRTLGISGEEFLRRWDNREYQPVPDDTEGRKVARMAMMIPFARRTPA